MMHILTYTHIGQLGVFGFQCKRLHTDVCPDRDDKGSCPKGNACRLRHPLKSYKRKQTTRYTDADDKNATAGQTKESKLR